MGLAQVARRGSSRTSADTGTSLKETSFATTGLGSSLIKHCLFLFLFLCDLLTLGQALEGTLQASASP